jgi:hypothetical protein
MPRARAGMSSLGAMSDAIVQVRLGDMVWLPRDGREASAATRVFLVEIGALCVIKAMVPIVVMADVYPSGLIGGTCWPPHQTAQSRFSVCAAPRRSPVWRLLTPRAIEGQ